MNIASSCCGCGASLNTIHLARLELKIAALIGSQRYQQSIQHGLEPGGGVKRSMEIDMLRAECQLAITKFIGRYPEFTMNTFKAFDVAGLQVRGIPSSLGRLIYQWPTGTRASLCSITVIE